MPFVPVDISAGQSAVADPLSPLTSSVVNWEPDETGVNVPRPALVAHALASFTTDPIVGLESWRGYIIVVTQNASTGVRRIWAINDLVPTAALDLTDATTLTGALEGSFRPVFAQGADYIYVTGGGRVMRWNPTLRYAEIMSSSPYCTHVAAIGQRLVANDITAVNQFAWSDIGEGSWTTWPAANVAEADARPDAVKAIHENINDLYVFGDSTVQAFAVGSDPYFPYDPTSTINLGLGAPYAVVRMDEVFAILDDHRRIVRTDCRSYEDMSQSIRKDLRDLTDVSDAWGWREERGARSLLGFCFPTAGRCFVLDLDSKKWHERDVYVAPFHRVFPVTAHVQWTKWNYELFAHSTSGLYRLDPTVYTDQGSVPIVCDRVTGWTDHGSRSRKRSNCLKVILRRGTATGTSGVLEVRVQDDDKPWSDWEQVEIGTASEYDHVQQIYVGGIFYRRRYQVRYSNSDQTALVGLEDDVQELAY